MTPREAFRLIEYERKTQLRLLRRAEAQYSPALLTGYLEGVAAGLSAANIHVQQIDDFDEEFE